MISRSSQRTMVQPFGVEYRSFVAPRVLVLARDYVFEALALAAVVITQIEIWRSQMGPLLPLLKTILRPRRT